MGVLEYVNQAVDVCPDLAGRVQPPEKGPPRQMGPLAPVRWEVQ